MKLIAAVNSGFPRPHGAKRGLERASQDGGLDGEQNTGGRRLSLHTTGTHDMTNNGVTVHACALSYCGHSFATSCNAMFASLTFQTLNLLNEGLHDTEYSTASVHIQ